MFEIDLFILIEPETISYEQKKTMILKLLYRAIYKLETFKLSLHNSLIFYTILHIKRVSRTKCPLP